EIISFDEASKITNAGIASVGHNCKNLRFIQNGYPNKIEKTEIDALVKSFPRPKAPELSRDGLTLSTKAPELNHDGPAAFTKAALCHIL
ncbi:MAG: hypothetical protein VX777_08440, partial [Chlamydiota bacterium]|nr:hypothetical protein [Chlamydiota bacterium]